jgi:deoxycytidylate deaminase
METFLKNIGFFRLAIEQSKKSTHKVKVGAVLANKRPVARGYNKIKSHPIWANPSKHVKISIHAEIDCLMDSSASEGDTMYVYREDSLGWPALARPCVDCMKVLKERGIRKVIYSIAHPPYYKEEFI